jgi:hypothetical protein
VFGRDAHNHGNAPGKEGPETVPNPELNWAGQSDHGSSAGDHRAAPRPLPAVSKPGQGENACSPRPRLRRNGQRAASAYLGYPHYNAVWCRAHGRAATGRWMPDALHVPECGRFFRNPCLGSPQDPDKTWPPRPSGWAERSRENPLVTVARFAPVGGWASGQPLFRIGRPPGGGHCYPSSSSCSRSSKPSSS